MNVTVEDVASCRKRLTIQIPADEVSNEWKGILIDFQKYAQIPGFRAGRAPAAILESRYSKEIASEVQRKLIPQAFREAVAKEKIRAVSMPSIEGVKFARNEALSFLATVDVAPEFKLPIYKGLKVKKVKVEVKDEDVENTLKMLADQQAGFKEIQDRGLKLGDFAVISYLGTCDGKPLSEICPAARPISENSQFWLLMGKDSFLPGFCEPLIDAKIGEKKQIDIAFPKDFRIKELTEKKASYTVEILGIREKQLPAMDDAFAKGYQAENLDDLKGKIRENLQKKRDQESDGAVKNQIVEQLLKAVPFDIPESLVAEETRNTMMDIVRENQMRGLAEEDIRGKSKEILDFAQASAKDKVRASFILARIAEEEKMEVKDADLQEYMKTIAIRAGKPLDALQAKVRESGEMDLLREQLLISRALDLLASSAIVEAD